MAGELIESAVDEGTPRTSTTVTHMETGEARTPADEALIQEWVQKIQRRRTDLADWHKQVRKNMQIARLGADDQWIKDGNFVVPILPRVINQAVAQLYARNPTASVTRRRKIRYRLWDGQPDSLNAAIEMAQIGDPMGMQIVQEVAMVRQHEAMLDRMAQTLKLTWEYYLSEQSANYKQQMKALVRRTKVCGVGWVKLSYQRLLEKNPEVTARIADASEQLARMQAILHGVETGDIDQDAAEMAELEASLAALRADEEIISREGPILDFPKVFDVVWSDDTTHLKTLSGTSWMSQVYEFTPMQVQEHYDVDVSSTYTPYKTGTNSAIDRSDKQARVRVHEIWDRRNGLMMVLCEGHREWLRAPARPDAPLERFYPFFPLIFNEAETETEIVPPSDVEQAHHIQKEYNRSREGLREHRIANTPGYVVGQPMDEPEKTKLTTHAPHEIVTLKILKEGMKIEDILQRIPTSNIDPNLYEVESFYGDLQRAVGVAESGMGVAGGATATGESIAEQSRSVAQSDNVDDLDELLTDLSRAAGGLLLTQIDKATVVEIVGEGAVWPDAPQTRAEAAKELDLVIEAGSSGRPNRAAELANFERAWPLLSTAQGIKPEPLIRKYAALLDIDPDELYEAGAPSMTALNALIAKAGMMASQPPAPGADPAMQGAEGGLNAPDTQIRAPGPQPGYTAPSDPAGATLQ